MHRHRALAGNGRRQPSRAVPAHPGEAGQRPRIGRAAADSAQLPPAARSPRRRRRPSPTRPPTAASLHPQVVGAALALFTVRGYQWSLQFEAGQKWERYAPGLQPGALLGRRVVSASGCGPAATLRLPATPPCSADQHPPVTITSPSHTWSIAGPVRHPVARVPGGPAPAGGALCRGRRRLEAAAAARGGAHGSRPLLPRHLPGLPQCVARPACAGWLGARQERAARCVLLRGATALQMVAHTSPLPGCAAQATCTAPARSSSWRACWPATRWRRRRQGGGTGESDGSSRVPCACLPACLAWRTAAAPS